VDDSGLRLDGNSLAGALREVFAHEMTSARIACAGCGNVEPIGAEHAYLQAPGIVLRCRHCDDVLFVMTGEGGRHLIGFPRSRWLEFEESSES
jgi:ribosomal protein S27E